MKNFAKHQGIKVTEKEISNNKEEDVKNINVPVNENLKVEINEDKDIIIADDSIEEEKSRDNLLSDIPIILGIKKGRKRNKKLKDGIIDIFDTDEEIEDNSTCFSQDGVIPLREGESNISDWSFG